MHGKQEGSLRLGQEKGDGPHLPRQSRSPQEVLRQFGLSADKRFGQHFLASSRVVDAILRRAAGAKGYLEIGPGVGVLTEPLCELGEVVAVELDQRVLVALVSVAPAAKIVNEDVLKCDLGELLESLPEPRCVVSNMPYNITGPLLDKIAARRAMYRNAVLMMQKEVGDKILAQPGERNRGALSACMQLQFEIAKVCDAPAGAFVPPPKVDSVVLDFVPRRSPFKEHRLFAVIHQGSHQPRKTLLNNLAKVHGREAAQRAIEGAALVTNTRPHQVTNEQWVEIAKHL